MVGSVCKVLAHAVADPLLAERFKDPVARRAREELAQVALALADRQVQIGRAEAQQRRIRAEADLA